MNILFYDWETFYDKDYSLRKMSPAEYILDPRFEALGCSFILNDKPPLWVDGPEVPDFLEQVPWNDTYAVSHNALFDACILKWRYNCSAKMWGDTIAMARNWLWHECGSAALASLSKHLGLPDKMLTLGRTLGKRFADIVADPMLHRELELYGNDDALKCKLIFQHILEDGFPRAELKVIDRQIRMATNPKFVIRQQVLEDYHARILEQKANVLAEIDMTLDDKSGLMSNDRLALLLLANGVVPPMKISPTTKKETYAFAKTDEDFTDLLDHPDPQVQAIVAARLAVKTTIEETRTMRFMNVGNLAWPEWENPQSMPIALKYSGAHTKRFSGDWLMNQQNLGRDSEIRMAIEAPEGKKVAAADASQIECRVEMGLGKMIAVQKGHPHSNILEQFRNGEDVYASFISGVYNRAINKVEHPQERFIGKMGVLSLGYGASWPIFQGMVRVQSKGKTIIHDVLASQTVSVFRTTYPEVPMLWKEGDQILWAIANSREDEWHKFGPVWIGKDVIVLPNGNRLNYRDLHEELETDPETGKQRKRWWYYFGKRKKSIYGSKVIENIVQALAFMLVMEADQRVAELTQGQIELAHQVHDELVYVVDDRHAQAVADLAAREIAKSPAWMPDLPLAAERGWAQSYGGIKKH